MSDPTGHWSVCDTCAAVFWWPFGARLREVHGVYLGCERLCNDEERLDAARDEADERNRLEQTAAENE